MLKGTDAKLARHPSEGEVGLVTSSLSFVKWNKESAPQWKVLDLLWKQWFSQQGLDAAEGTFCRKDGGLGAGETVFFKNSTVCTMEHPRRKSEFAHRKCELAQSVLEKPACPWEGLCESWCVAAHVTSPLCDSSLLRLING